LLVTQLSPLGLESQTDFVADGTIRSLIIEAFAILKLAKAVFGPVANLPSTSVAIG
jgi:hypothetical protein